MNDIVNDKFILPSNQKIINYLFIIIVFILTRQFPFSFLSPVMNLAVVLIIALSLAFKKQDKYSLCLILILLVFPLSCNLLYSFFLTDNKIVIGSKFYVTLLCVGLAYFVKVDKKGLKAFVIICLLQVIVLLSIFLYIRIFLNINTYLPLRAFFLDKEWGDVYTYDGVYYKVQIKGSALLVLAFILNLEMPLFKRKYLVALFLVVGIILAGNFAFLVSMAIYILYKACTLNKVKSLPLYSIKLIIFALVILAASPFIFEYVLAILELKNDVSLGTRSDQSNVLMNSLLENPFTLLLGQGLGHTLSVKTIFRDYTGNTYFELQILYILNQLGVLVFFIFTIYNLLIMLKLWGKGSFKIYLAYAVYISYSITNPYIADTNHVIAIIVLNSWAIIDNKMKYENEHFNYNIA